MYIYKKPPNASCHKILLQNPDSSSISMVQFSVFVGLDMTSCCKAQGGNFVRHAAALLGQKKVAQDQPENGRSAKDLRCYRQGFEDLLLGKFPDEKKKKLG